METMKNSVLAKTGELLETLTAVCWFLTFGVGGLICYLCTPIFVYLFFFTGYWPLGVAYLCWYFYDRKSPYEGGYRFHLFRWLPTNKLVNSYFSGKVVATAELSRDKNYILGLHPHGVINVSLCANFGSSYSNARKIFYGFRMYAAAIDLFFGAPLFREFLLGIGAVSARKESLEYLLGSDGKGVLLVIAVGGAAETAYSSPGQYRIILKRRKGVFKLALRTGSSLLPAIGFGDNDLFEPLRFPPGSIVEKMIQSLKKYFGFYLYLPASLIPRRVQVTTVVGKPIDVPKMSHPTSEDIDHYQVLYTEELIKLFNEHKTKYIENGEKAELVIVE